MTKFNFLSITTIFLTFVLTIGNYFVFSEKSVKVDAILESSSPSNNLVSSSSSIRSSSLSSRNSSPKSSSKVSSSRSQSSSSLTSKKSSSSIQNSSPTFMVSSSLSSTISRLNSSNSVSLTNSSNSKNYLSSSSSNSQTDSIVSSSASSTNSVLPIKITEVGFTRPEEYNSKICTNYCGQFKWVEIYNPNETEINLKDYRMFFGKWHTDSITDSDFFVKQNSYSLIKSYNLDQPKSIIDDYPSVVSNFYIRNVDNQTQNNISVVIQNKAKVTIDSFVIDNLNSVAGSNSGKIKTSFFRCSNPSQNQNYTLTEKKATNQIPYNNTLGYEFYGTPSREDDSCVAKSSSSAQPLIVGPTFNSTSPLLASILDTKLGSAEVTLPALEVLKSAVNVTDSIPQTVKISEAAKIPELVTETKTVVNKLLKFHSEVLQIEKDQSLYMNNKVESIQYQYATLREAPKISTLIQDKTTTPSLQLVIKPTTRKVILPIVNDTTKENEVIEVDYQPSQLQWNFLSLIAIAFVMSRIYREFRDKIGVEVFGIRRV